MTLLLFGGGGDPSVEMRVWNMDKVKNIERKPWHMRFDLTVNIIKNSSTQTFFSKIDFITDGTDVINF